MSENLDLVRSIRSGWGRGDFSGAAEWAHPEVEFGFVDFPDGAVSRDLPEALARMREFLRAWESWRVEADDYRVLDQERVLVLTRHQGRGKTSGVDIGSVRPKGAELFQICNGKVTRLILYSNRDRALADLGLEE
jgi:hypothetical protein